MGQAIATGAPEEVTTLLKRLGRISDNAEAVRQLTGCYGGGNWFPIRRRGQDSNGLFRLTAPILHAAHTGNTLMFSTVYGAMRDKLRAQQVERGISAIDKGGRSVLTMAVMSKNADMVEAVLCALDEVLTAEEVKAVMMFKFDRKNILNWAATSGSKDVFEATVKALEKRLKHEEVKAILGVSPDGRCITNPTLMSSAATSGNEETWDAVIDTLGQWISKHEVQYMMAAAEPKDSNVLHAAVQSGSIGIFHAVLADLNRHLIPNKVEGLIGSRDNLGNSILHCAANSGSKEIFLAALGVVGKDQVKQMMMPSFEPDVVVSVLHAAAGSGNEDCFKAVLAAVENELEAVEVKATIKSTGRPIHWISRVDKTGNYRSTILHSAADSGNTPVIEAVMCTLRENLDVNEIKAILAFTGSNHDEGTHIAGRERTVGQESILHSAVTSGNQDAFEAMLAVTVDGISSPEVKSLMISAAKNEGLRRLAVGSGNVELWRVVAREMGEELAIDDDSDLSCLLDAAACGGYVRMWDAVTKVAEQRGGVIPRWVGTHGRGSPIFLGLSGAETPPPLKRCIGLT
eukprot:g10773.t2